MPVRVLFSTLGGIGHVHPLVPLARALIGRGHEVRWATGAESCGRLEQAGIAAEPAGQTQAERMGEFWRRYPETRQLPPQQWPDVMFPKIFGEISPRPALNDLLALVKSWQPDLVVHDAAEFAAAITAATVGVPHVTHSFGALLPEARVRAAGEAVAGLWRELGLEPAPYGGAYDHLYVDIYPPRLQSQDAAHVGRRQHLRPVAFDGAPEDREGSEVVEEAEGPLVYLTFGTVFNDNDAFRTALDAIAGLGVRVIVTVGPNGDPSAFGRQPSHVVVERYIPQTLILGACDVVASHAGSGTVLAALGSGIPQLCLPQAADQFINAAAVAHAGAGLAIAPGDVDVPAVLAAVRQLLDDPGFRLRAGTVADEIAAMPSPDEVARVLETLS